MLQPCATAGGIFVLMRRRDTNGRHQAVICAEPNVDRAKQEFAFLTDSEVVKSEYLSSPRVCIYMYMKDKVKQPVAMSHCPLHWFIKEEKYRIKKNIHSCLSCCSIPAILQFYFDDSKIKNQVITSPVLFSFYKAKPSDGHCKQLCFSWRSLQHSEKEKGMDVTGLELEPAVTCCEGYILTESCSQLSAENLLETGNIRENSSYSFIRPVTALRMQPIYWVGTSDITEN